MRKLACLTIPAFLTLALITGIQAGDGKGTEVTLDKLKSTTPPNWKAVTPSNKFRAYQFSVPKVQGDDKDAEVAVFFFGPGGGGSAEDNIKRWKGMFRPPEGKTIEQASKVGVMTVGKAELTYLDVQGTYVFKNPPFDPKAKEERYRDYRMLGVYFACDNGPYFIRLTGPAKTVEQSRKGFDEWLKNFK
jgi:hypothetical protein